MSVTIMSDAEFCDRCGGKEVCAEIPLTFNDYIANAVLCRACITAAAAAFEKEGDRG